MSDMSDMGSLVDAWEQAIRRAAHDAVDTPESAYDWGASDHKAALLSAIAALVAERDELKRSVQIEISVRVAACAARDRAEVGLASYKLDAERYAKLREYGINISYDEWISGDVMDNFVDNEI